MDNLFPKIVSLENLFNSWYEFRKGKRGKFDVQEFERDLEDNLFDIYFELKTKSYNHSNYSSFYITDPKLRHIHKACVKDRLVHHAIYRILYPIFDKTFIPDSYSCRVKKGTHKAVDQLDYLVKNISQNRTKDCWVLKCDIKKFFVSVDHEILFRLICGKISDEDVLSLIWNIISSFAPPRERERVERLVCRLGI
jgi:retron-type reverse transcriptase